MSYRIVIAFIVAAMFVSCKPKDRRVVFGYDKSKYDSITAVLKSEKSKDQLLSTVDTNFSASEGGEAISTRYEPPKKIDNTKFAVKFYQKGIKEYENGNYALGVEEFRKVTQMKPNHKGAWYNLAIGRYMLKNYPDALNDFKKALELDRTDTVTVLYCGLSCYYMQDLKNAIAWFDTAITMNPRFSNAFFNRGTAKGQLSDYRGAIEDLSKAIEIEPGYTDAYMNRGNAYYYYGNREQACSDWKKARELGSTEVDDVLKAYCGTK